MARQGYHHGTLRQAPVDAPPKPIEEKGPQGFTLSEAAKGVTPAAIRRHARRAAGAKGPRHG